MSTGRFKANFIFSARKVCAALDQMQGPLGVPSLITWPCFLRLFNSDCLLRNQANVTRPSSWVGSRHETTHVLSCKLHALLYLWSVLRTIPVICNVLCTYFIACNGGIENICVGMPTLIELYNFYILNVENCLAKLLPEVLLLFSLSVDQQLHAVLQIWCTFILL